MKPGDRVLVKPNLLASREPEKAVTTHPAVVRAALRAVQEAGGEPVLGDSPGGRNTPANYAALLRRTGLAPVLEECGVEAVFFDEPTVEIPSPSGRVYKRFRVAGAVADADAIVSLSKFKTHQFTLATGAVKNCFGYIPGVAKAEYHLNTGMDQGRFAALLLDLYLARPPVLSVMDAVIGMEGNGPSNGTPARGRAPARGPARARPRLPRGPADGLRPARGPERGRGRRARHRPPVRGRARGPGGPRRRGAAPRLPAPGGPLARAASRPRSSRP